MVQSTKPKTIRKRRGGNDPLNDLINVINNKIDYTQRELTKMNNLLDELCKIQEPKLKASIVRHIITIIEGTNSHILSAKTLQNTLKDLSQDKDKPISIAQQDEFRKKWNDCLILMLKYKTYFKISNELIASPNEPNKILEKPAWKICRLLYLLKRDWLNTTTGSGCFISKQTEPITDELEQIELDELQEELEEEFKKRKDNVNTVNNLLSTSIVFTPEEEEQFMKELEDTQVGGKKKRVIKKKV